MSKINITRSKKSVSATAYLPHGAYKHACELALAQNGIIGKTANGFFKADFDTVETADKFVRTWRADYATAHAAYTPKEKSTKKSKPSSTKKGKGAIKVSKAVEKALAPYAGKGKSANHEVADVLRGMGIVPNGTEWDYWKTIR